MDTSDRAMFWNASGKEYQDFVDFTDRAHRRNLLTLLLETAYRESLKFMLIVEECRR